MEALLRCKYAGLDAEFKIRNTIFGCLELREVLLMGAHRGEPAGPFLPLRIRIAFPIFGPVSNFPSLLKHSFSPNLDFFLPGFPIPVSCSPLEILRRPWFNCILPTKSASTVLVPSMPGPALAANVVLQ